MKYGLHMQIVEAQAYSKCTLLGLCTCSGPKYAKAPSIIEGSRMATITLHGSTVSILLNSTTQYGIKDAPLKYVHHNERVREVAVSWLKKITQAPSYMIYIYILTV